MSNNNNSIDNSINVEFTNYKLYQLPSDSNFRFLPYDFLNESQINEINSHMYNKVYEGVFEKPLFAIDSLNYLWETFNINHPSDFYGHSLSVSDVIVVYNNDYAIAFYVDGFGFKSIENWERNEKNNGLQYSLH